MYLTGIDRKCADIAELDQVTGSPQIVVTEQIVYGPYSSLFRIARAETSYDFEYSVALMEIPEETIRENMRMTFEDGQEFRIHSITKWPLVNPKYIEIVLQSVGTATT